MSQIDLGVFCSPGRGHPPAVSTVPAYVQTILDLEPVAFWHFKNNLQDSIGSFTLTASGGSSFVDPLPVDNDSGFDCAGVRSLSVAHHADLKPATGCIGGWFRPNSLHDAWIVSADQSGLIEDDFAMRIVADGTMGPYWQVGGVQTWLQSTSVVYSPGDTVQWIAGWDESGVYFWFNGKLIRSSTGHTTGLTDNTQDWLFGSSFASDLFNGVIDDVFILDFLPTQNQAYIIGQLRPPA